MINYRVLSLLIFVITSVLVSETYAQEANFDFLAKIIKSGNAKDLVKQFSKTVELNIDGEEASYSQAQAEAVLKEFFNQSSPLSFDINHKGASKGGLPYAIGEYKNGLGVYRVWIRLKPEGDRNFVYEMSFIKE